MSEFPHEWGETVHKLEELANEAALASSDAMHQFVSRSDGGDWVLVERVFLIATRVRDELHKSYVAASVQRKRRLLAMALFELGETSVTDVLLEAVEKDSDIYPVVASKLANRGVEKAVTPIVNRLLLEWRGGNPQALLTLLVALQKLTTELPPFLYENLASHDSPEIRAEISKFQPSS